MRRFPQRFVLSGAACALLLGVGLAAWALAAGSSEAVQGNMQNCPQAGKWAISVWSGDNGADAGQAFATCGPGAVAAAYHLNPQTQGWLRWLADRPQLSDLLTLNDKQGVLALGSATGPVTTPTATPTPTGSPTATPTRTPTPTPTPQTLTMVANPIEGGTTSPPPGTHWYDYGITVPVSAIAEFGWMLDYWSYDCSGEDPDTFVEMDGDKTCIANFTCGPYVFGTYTGDVWLDGQLAQDGTYIEVWIDGIRWCDGLTYWGEYYCDVPQYSPQEPPCFEGGWMEFYADGIYCNPSPVWWESGLHEVDLDCWS